MATSNVDGEVIVGINKSASKPVIYADLKQILSQIKDLEVKIGHQKLDKSAIKELQTQLDSLKTTLTVSDINVNQNQVTRTGQQIVQKLGSALQKGVSIDSLQKAVDELEKVDTFLTKIGNEDSSFSRSRLEHLGDASFDTASKYGKTASDYLANVLELSRAGYENADSLGELSAAVQSAGNLTGETANKYMIATDKAFQMNGSVEALTKTLDGANSITDHNAVNMTELAEGMSVVSSQAASSQMEIQEATAAVGTMIAVTGKSGSEMGNALKNILMYLRQITGEADGNKIDADSLDQYRKACEALGVSLSEVKNGAVQLKEPMEILKELSEAYTGLDESDARRQNLLEAVGGANSADALNAILENYSLYEQMLQDYASGQGSIAAEAEKTANSWEGSLNRLSNTWADTIGNILNSDIVITGIDALNGLLGVVNSITDALGPLGSIGLGAGLFAGLENIGKCRMSIRISDFLLYCFEYALLT